MIEKHMTGKFLGNLVELFASEDHRERVYLMMILHKIYGRCLKLRPYIINIMSSYFYRMIYYDEFQHVNGIIELLQIISVIIPGLTVPVKDSYQSFVRNILVPLHKVFLYEFLYTQHPHHFLYGFSAEIYFYMLALNGNFD